MLKFKKIKEYIFYDNFFHKTKSIIKINGENLQP